MLSVRVELADKRVFSVEADSFDALKAAVQEKEGINTTRQRYFKHGRNVTQCRSFAQAGIYTDGATLQLRPCLKGGYTTERIYYVIPAIFTIIFVGCAIAGPILVTREMQAYPARTYGVIWWVGIALCITAAVSLLFAIIGWLNVLCCD